MTSPLKYSVGFDCSKEDYSACISLIDTTQEVTIKSTRDFKNTAKGFNNAHVWIKQHCKLQVPVVIVMEATGNYYENLAFQFNKLGYHVSVVLPNKAKKYMESRGIKTKNDPVDARGLAQMAAEQKLNKWEPMSEQMYQIRLLTRHCENLATQKTRIKNQIKSLEFGMYKNNQVEEDLKNTVKLIERQIKDAKKKIEAIIQGDPIMKQRFNQIIAIKGLGLITLATVIAETNKFELFYNQRQLTSYAGYDIVENQSGKRVGKTKISKKGNSHIRRAMHMPALNVVRYGEPEFVNLYKRIMGRTNIKMKAYVAIQRKLLCLIYTLWSKNEAYDPDYYKTSGNDEPKILFSPGFEKAVKKVVPEQSPRTTQDELPCNESPEVLFSLLQNY
jgi:transposase